MPSSQISPELGESRPASNPSSVLLPLPLAPTMATNCPGGNAERDSFQNLYAPRAILNPLSCISNLNHSATLLNAGSRLTQLHLFVDVRRLSRFICYVLLPPGFFSSPRRSLFWSVGDSITAGHGLAEGQSSRMRCSVVVAQDTITKSSTRAPAGPQPKTRLTAASDSRLHPDVVIVEFGGNDGLRGLPLDQTSHNLDRFLGACGGACRVLLAGITLPPNYGPDYIKSFDEVFRTLATRIT